MMRISVGGLLAVVMSLLLAACGEQAPRVVVKEGEPMPAITLTDLDGGTLTLESLRGKLVVLHLWASWCAPCRTELPLLQRAVNKLDPERIVVLGVSVDEDANLVREFNLRYQTPFARHIDPDRELAEGVLAATAYPETLLIAPDGTLLRRMVGDQNWDSPLMMQVLEDAYAGRRTQSGAYYQ